VGSDRVGFVIAGPARDQHEASVEPEQGPYATMV